MADLEELTQPLTKDEVEASIYAALEAQGVTTTTWKPGAVTRTVISGVSIVLAAFSSLQATTARAGFLDFSVGEWLALVARFVYGVIKDEGTFASGKVQLTNTGGGLYVVAVGDMVVRNSSSNKTYRNTEAFTLDPLATLEVSIQAEEAGSASTAGPGDIDTLVTSLPGVDVTNPQSVVGTDEETDEQLKERCRSSTAALSPNGPSDSYRYIATSAKKDNGEKVNITRVTTIADGSGNVSVYVGSPSGAVEGTIGDTSTDLGAADEAIQVSTVPLAVTATTISAATRVVDFAYTLWVRNTIGLSSNQIQTLARNALISYLALSPIGGFRKTDPTATGAIFEEALRGVVSDAVGSEDIVDIFSNVGDSILAATDAAAAGLITGNVIFVRPAT